MLNRLALCIGLVGGCATTPVDTGSAEQAIRTCPEDMCGGNSPTIAHYGFFNFNLDGAPNDGGFTLLGMSQGRDFYNLLVQDSHIIGLGPKGNISGHALVGATIWINGNGRQFGIVIDDVDTTYEVVSPYLPIETYILDYGAVISNPLQRPIPAGYPVEAPPTIGKKQAVCPYPPDFNANGRIEWKESEHMSRYQSLVYEGDVIDPEKRTIDPVENDRWFNIGCAAHLLTKLRLTRNTIRLTTQPNAQAALKALSADYCGFGTGYTISGQPLLWRESAVNMVFWQTPKQGLEARWNEYGALCLVEPRVLNSPYAAGQFPTVQSDIDNECLAKRGYVLPRCRNPDPNTNEYRGERVTSALRN